MSILIGKAEWMGSIRQSEAVVVNRVSQVFSEGSCWMNRIHSRVCDVSGWDLTLDSLFDVPSQVKCISV